MKPKEEKREKRGRNVRRSHCSEHTWLWAGFDPEEDLMSEEDIDDLGFVIPLQ